MKLLRFCVSSVLFLSFLLIGLSFVDAEQKVCCSETFSGSHCDYVPASDCKPGALMAAAACEQTSFCKLGCGYDQSSGACFKSTPKFSCEQGGNCSWSASPSCDIPQCQQGCCVLSNECSFTTQLQCKKATSLFEDVEMTFKEEITNELECVNQCRSFERGACVSADGSCTFTTRESCSEETSGSFNTTGPLVGFHPNKLCSHPQLGTECAAQQTTGCLPDADEVYWMDSCGNPENIYDSNKVKSFNNGFVLSKEESCNPSANNINNPNCGNCQFQLGSLCGSAPSNVNPAFGDSACVDLSCGADDITQDQYSPASSTPKKLGESWCAYDAVPGSGQDPVGSRQYRRICINGKELTEPCKDYREEICIQGVAGEGPLDTKASFGLSQGSFLNAGCRDNRWQTCGDVDNEFDCNNVQQRDCMWVGQTVKPIAGKPPTDTDTKKNKKGKCVPFVPPGLKFWPDESAEKTPSADAKATCEKANSECTVVFEKGGFGGSKKCIGNCECKSKQWLLAQNTLCVAQGDCGAWVNIKGKGTTHGFIVSDNHPSELSASDVNEFGQVVFLSKKDGEYSNKFSAFFKKSWFPLGVLGTEFVFAWEKFGWEVAKGFVGPVQGTVLAGFGQSLPEGFAKGALYKQTAGFAEGLQAVKVSFAAGADPQVLAQSIQSQFGPEAAAAFEQSISQQVVGPMGPVQLNSQMVEKAYYDSVPKGQTSTFLGLSPELLSSINTVMWIWTIYSLVDVLFAKTSEETYSVECQPWVAPVGGSDCESCGDDGKECSEYRCKSLGQLCKLVNPGTKKEMCINSHPNDVAAPVVSADVSALEKGYTLSEKAGEGYTVSPQIEPFTAVSLGIKTNEPSQCKYSMNHSISYDQMTAYFGDSLYDYNHTITFSVPDEFSENEELLKLTNGGQFKFFVRCQDGNGNQNEKDYYITFAVKKGPDLTPPVIELTSIANGAFMPANVNSTYFVMYVNEPSTCKWNDLDADYDDMLHSFSCSNQGLPTSSLYYGLYDCATVLDGIDVNALNKYYFRCKDQPNQPASEQNVNQESYLFTLKGTVPLEITSVSPETGSSLLTLSPELKVVTSKGAQGGHAVCGYSFVDDNPANAIDFLFTNSTVHTQTFANLTSGSYTAHITCVDAAGNYDQEKVTFSVAADTGGPQIAQVYTEGNLLFLVTNEASTCEYSTTGFFTYGSGVQMTGTQTKEHQASLDSDVYYIICQDNAGNLGKYTLFV